MGRLLTALRTIEARGSAVFSPESAAPETASDALESPSSVEPLEKEPPAWPGEIDYDSELEFPSHWSQPSPAGWSAPTGDGLLNDEVEGWPQREVQCEPAADSSAVSWANDGEAESLADVENAEIEGLEEIAEEMPAETAANGPLWPPAIPGGPETVLDHVASLLAEEEIASTTIASAEVEQCEKRESIVAESNEPSIDEGEQTASVLRELPMTIEAEPAEAIDEEKHSSASELDEAAEELPVSVRMPGFGRPNRHSPSPQHRSEETIIRRPASVPFLPPSQRPYREACESILAALPQERSVALVLAWTDDDLDHCTLMARLAEVMADRLDDPVLLIDVGQQRRLSSLLQAQSDGSLTEALAGIVSWRDEIVQTGTAGLCLLPSAPGDFNSDPVAVARLVEACKEDFAIVLIAGCALPAMPDNILMACDTAVLMMETGHTAAGTATGAVERLRRSGTDVAGCLLTAAE